jgi:DNA polymerase-1
MLIADQVLDEDVALGLTKQALSSDVVAIDTETNGEDVRDGRGFAYGVSLAYRSSNGLVSYYMPFRHQNPGLVGNYECGPFLPILQRILSERPCVFHNAKFDLVSLSTLGLDVGRTNFFCTMKGAHLVDENLFSYSLDEVCKYYLGRPGKQKSDTFKKFESVTGWAGMPPEVHGEYAAYDTYSTFELYETLVPLFKAENLGSVWERKQEFIRLLISMEQNGVRIDPDFCDAMAEEGEIRQTEIRQAWRRRYGRDLNPMSPGALHYLLIEQLRLPVVLNRKTGRPTFNKDAMEQYDQILEMIDNPLAKEIKEYRGWNKSVSSNYKAYLEKVSSDGRLRPNFIEHGTKTGRLSCRKPNLQQIPRSGDKLWNGDMKKCFIPEDGYQLVECDYSQLEFRLAAATAREQSLLEAFANPTRDVFREMGEALGWERQDAKQQTYATLYGAGKDQVAFIRRVSLARAKELINDFYDLYPNLRKVSRLAAREVERTGKIELWSGRFRHFRYPDSESHKAFNSYIQGGAADIVEASMVRCAKAGLNDGTRSRMLLQVHDSVVFEVRDDDVKDAKEEIASIMSAVEPDFGVVFKAEPKKWGE